MGEIVERLAEVMRGQASSLLALGVLCLGTTTLLVSARQWWLHRIQSRWWLRRLSVPRRLDHDSLGRPRGQADRRRSPRRAGNPVPVILVDEDERKLGEGRVTDRSFGGVCVTTAARLSPGAKVRIVPLGRVDSAPAVPVEVCNAHRVRDQWRLGCAYLRQPSWSALMYLR